MPRHFFSIKKTPDYQKKFHKKTPEIFDNQRKRITNLFQQPTSSEVAVKKILYSNKN